MLSLVLLDIRNTAPFSTVLCASPYRRKKECPLKGKEVKKEVKKCEYVQCRRLAEGYPVPSAPVKGVYVLEPQKLLLIVCATGN